jgi:hypothetical protein
MRRHAERIEENANMLVRRAAIAVDATVVLATPVDTGRARANWQASLGGPETGVREAYIRGSKGSTGAANAHAAQEQARAVIAARRPGQTVHITNNLPYIGALNDGHSALAPAGFVETAVLRGLAAVKGAPGIVTGRVTDGE